MRRRYHSFVPLLLVGAAVLTPTPGSAAAAARSVWPSKCITDDPVHRGSSIMPQLKRLGVRVWTTGLSWASVAATRPTDPQDPLDPAYTWPASLDAAVASAVANKIDPVLYVNRTPGWANGGKANTWAPTDPQDYADFVVAAHRHYPLVRRWQIISEPSKAANFQPSGAAGARAYASILDAAYQALHEDATARGTSVVVIGANTHNVGADAFLAAMKLPDGSRPRLDLLGINPYTQVAPDISQGHRAGLVNINDLDWLLQWADAAYPGRNLKLFIGEFAWITGHGNTSWLYVVSQSTQAQWMGAAWNLAAKLRRVDTMCWFQLYDSPEHRLPNGSYTNWTSGLRTATGASKPAYKVFKYLPSGPKRLRLPPT